MLGRMRLLLLAMCCVMGGLLWLAPARAQPSQPRVEGEVAYQAKSFGVARYASLGVGGGLELEPGIEASVGARLLLGALRTRPGLSGFARANLYAVRGLWRPALGLELEATTHTRPVPNRNDISGSFARQYEARDVALLRVGVVMAPLRIQTERLLVVLGSLRLATPIATSAGQRLYFGVTVLGVGWLL